MTKLSIRNFDFTLPDAYQYHTFEVSKSWVHKPDINFSGLVQNCMHMFTGANWQLFTTTKMETEIRESLMRISLSGLCPTQDTNLMMVIWRRIKPQWHMVILFVEDIMVQGIVCLHNENLSCWFSEYATHLMDEVLNLWQTHPTYAKQHRCTAVSTTPPNLTANTTVKKDKVSRT